MVKKKKNKYPIAEKGIHDFIRDAWKKLEGMSELEAKHRYVEILLQVAMEVNFICNKKGGIVQLFKNGFHRLIRNLQAGLKLIKSSNPLQ